MCCNLDHALRDTVPSRDGLPKCSRANTYCALVCKEHTGAAYSVPLTPGTLGYRPDLNIKHRILMRQNSKAILELSHELIDCWWNSEKGDNRSMIKGALCRFGEEI